MFTFWDLYKKFKLKTNEQIIGKLTGKKAAPGGIGPPGIPSFGGIWPKGLGAVGF